MSTLPCRLSHDGLFTRQSRYGSIENYGKITPRAGSANHHYGTVGRNPPPRRRNTELRAREYLTDAEINRLIVAASRNRHGHRDATMILIAYRHGLRVSELVTLRWDAIDFGHGRLHVNRAKNGSPAVHPISGRASLAPTQARARARFAHHLHLGAGSAVHLGRLPQNGHAVGRRRKVQIPRAPAHVAARLRVSIGQPGRRHPLPAGLSRAQKHPAHGALHRDVVDALQKLLEGLSRQPKAHRAKARGVKFRRSNHSPTSGSSPAASARHRDEFLKNSETTLTRKRFQDRSYRRSRRERWPPESIQAFPIESWRPWKSSLSATWLRPRQQPR